MKYSKDHANLGATLLALLGLIPLALLVVALLVVP